MKRAPLIIFVLVGVIALAGLLWGGNRQPGSTSGTGEETSVSSSGAETTAGSPAADLPFDTSILVVKIATVDCFALVEQVNGTVDKANGLIAPNIGALQPVPPRVDTDSFSTPVLSTDPVLARQEIQTAICQDPLLGLATAHMLANFDVKGHVVGDLNTWLAPYKGDPQITTWARYYLPTFGVARPTEDQWMDAAYKNREYIAFAERINTLLNRMKPLGIMSVQSVQNYAIGAAGLATEDGLPKIVLADYQENLPALVLGLTEKGNDCPIARLGFNTQDKRPELFTPNDCEPAPAPQPEQPGQPQQPGQPVTPAQPGNPAEPHVPNPPATPTNPGTTTPTEPTTPVTTPTEPTTPVTTPTEPTTPVTTPTEPTTDAPCVDPGVPGEGEYTYDPVTCTYTKVPGAGVIPSGGEQDNDPSQTAQPSEVPTEEPEPAPTENNATTGNDGGYVPEPGSSAPQGGEVDPDGNTTTAPAPTDPPSTEIDPEVTGTGGMPIDPPGASESSFGTPAVLGGMLGAALLLALIAIGRNSRKISRQH